METIHAEYGPGILCDKLSKNNETKIKTRDVSKVTCVKCMESYKRMYDTYLELERCSLNTQHEPITDKDRSEMLEALGIEHELNERGLYAPLWACYLCDKLWKEGYRKVNFND